MHGISFIVFLRFVGVSLLEGVIDLRMSEDLNILQSEADHHVRWIETDALSAPLAATPSRPLVIDDKCKQDKVQSNAGQHRPCDKFEIQRHLRGCTHACVAGSLSGSGESGEYGGRRKVTEGRKVKQRIESEALLIDGCSLSLRDDKAEQPQHRRKRNEEQGSMTMLHLRN
jgi:hypothetical protein